MKTLLLRAGGAGLALALASCATTQKPMTDENKATQEPTPPAAAPAQTKMSAPGASKLLTASADEFTKGCLADLDKAKAALAELAKLDPKKSPDLVLSTFDSVQALVSNAGARASVAKEAHPDAAMRGAAEKCEQEVEKLSTSIQLDRKVYDALAGVSLEGRDVGTHTWLERTLRDMRRLGVDRDEATRTKVKALNEEITLLGQEFGKNIREDVRFVELDPKQLGGMPEDYVRAHPKQANGKVKITTDTPDYMPFLTYAKDGKAREALWRVYRQRGNPKNLEVLQKLITKRHELATLLGYPSWAAYITENKMVKSAEKAAQFIDEVNRAAEKAAKREYDQLLALKKKDEPKAKQLEPWDQDYYEDRYKAQKFGFDSQAAREYFEYTKVLAGVLDVTSKMFGIRYEKVEGAQTWHPEVVTYDIHDESGLRGRIYLDMHPRPDKYKHAAQFELVVGQQDRAYPEGVLLCNFPKTGAEPGLMQPKEVETFFHEFGHLLHHIFGGRQRWAALSGVKTEWDFVEAPSMLLQEWASHGESLALFAKHHKSGQAIPAELVARMVAAKEFGKGLWTRRQMFLSAVSLNYYNRDPAFDSTKLAKELQPKFQPFRIEFVDGTSFQTSFGHLDGYSAIYYTYIWSSVIARDLLTAFTSEGVLNPSPAQRYRRSILEGGDSKEAAALVKDFLGREYNFKAYEAWLNTEPTLQSSKQ